MLERSTRNTCNTNNTDAHSDRSTLTPTGLPPISCPTRIVDVVKLEDFTRLSLAIPESAAAAVRVGAACRVNGAPLSVASVKDRHDGLGIIASFGVALNSPLTSTLSTMTAGASVRLEVETDSLDDVTDLDLIDAATSKRMREMQDGLPGTREWYNQALPWYSKMYPAVTAGGSAVDTGNNNVMRNRPSGNQRLDRHFTSEDERLSKDLSDAAERKHVDPSPALEDDVNTFSTNAYGNGNSSTLNPIPPPPNSAPPKWDANGGGEFKDSLEARIIDGWSSNRPPPPVDNPNETKRDMFSPSRSNRDVIEEEGIDYYNDSSNADPLANASLEVIGALENLARRNSHLTDRVETLLGQIESKGFGDAEVIDGLKRLEKIKDRGGSLDEDDKGGSIDEPEVRTSVDTSQESSDDVNAEVSKEVCVMSHPGALCCTRSEVVTDTAKGTASISLHTTVTAVEGAEGKKISKKDFIALGAKVIEAKANELANEKVADAVKGDTTPDQETAHETITRLLQWGKIVWVESMSEVEGKYGHPCYRLRIEDAKGSGEAIEAVFKPKIEGDGDGWHRASMEYVAYKLARMLGMDLVPPAAYRTGGIEVDYKKFDEGAFMYWVADAKELDQVGDFKNAVDTGCWGNGVDPCVVLSDTRVLDVLLQNSDRHAGHFLFGRHWTEGGVAGGVGGDPVTDGDSSSSSGDPRDGNGSAPLGGSTYLPCLIDHAASFRPEAFVSMEHDNAFQTGATVRVKSETYLRLRFLDAQTIEKEFSYFLSPDERRTLLNRRDTILAYLDDLVEKNGYDNVVIH